MKLVRAASLLLLLFVAAMSSSCGGGALPMRPADDHAHEAWIEPVLGRGADLVVIVRVHKLMSDATFGPLMTKLAHDAFSEQNDATLLHALIDCDEIDLEASGDLTKPDSMPWIAVMRGVPQDVDVRAIMRGNTPVFESIGRSIAGVDAYVAHDLADGAELLVFPDRTWILVAKDVAPRLAASATPPPPLPLEPDAMVASYTSGALIQLLSVYADADQRALVDGLDGCTGALFPSGHDDVTSKANLFYVDSSTASNAKTTLEAQIKKATAHSDDLSAILLKSMLSIHRNGRVVEVEVKVPTAVIGKLTP